MIYHSKIIENLLKKMNNEPFYIKIYRWYKLQKWIIYCYLIIDL
ncbi:MAG: hypothetical protein WDA02_02260 [Saccharofermentanales bacterium]